MRIAVWHNLPSGGGKRALYDHVAGLVARGHQVESWCPPTADQSYLPLSRLCREHVIPLAPLPTVRVGRWGRLRKDYREMAAQLASMDAHCQACGRDIDSKGFDILFANACTLFRVTPIAKYVRLPLAIYLGEPYRALFEAMPEFPWAALPPPSGGWTVSYLKRWIRDIADKQALRLQVREEISNARAFSDILVNSLFSRETILRSYGLENRVCYLGVDLARFKPSGEPKECFVIGLGTLYPGKGPDRALRALAAIPRPKRPRFIWVGNFSEKGYTESIQTLASSLDVTLELKINVSDADLISLLSRASVLLYTPRLEPFGLAPLEANACGTAVVAIAEGGIRESIKEGFNGFLAEGDQPEKLGQLVTSLISSVKLATEAGHRARRHVEEHWELQRGLDHLEKELLRTKDASSNAQPRKC